MTEPNQPDELRKSLLAMEPETPVTDAERLWAAEEQRLQPLKRTTLIVWLIVLALPVLAVILGTVVRFFVPHEYGRLLEGIIVVIITVICLLAFCGILLGVRLWFASRALSLSQINARLATIERQLRQRGSEKESR